MNFTIEFLIAYFQTLAIVFAFTCLYLLIVLWPFSWENAIKEEFRNCRAGIDCRVVKKWYGYQIEFPPTVLK
jgi:hypothetical protein